MEALSKAVELLGSDMGWRNKILKDMQYTFKLVAWYGLDRRGYSGAEAGQYQQVLACAKALSLARRFMIFFQWLEDLQEMMEAIRERKWAAAAIAGLEAANDLADDVITLYKAGLVAGKGGRTYNRLERVSDTLWGISNVANICVAYGKYRKAADAAAAEQQGVVAARQALAVSAAQAAEREALRRRLRRPMLPAVVTTAAPEAVSLAAEAAPSLTGGHEVLLPANGTGAGTGTGTGKAGAKGAVVDAAPLRRTRSDAGTGMAGATDEEEDGEVSVSSLSTASSYDSEGDEASSQAGSGVCGGHGGDGAAGTLAASSAALEVVARESSAAAANKARFVALLSVLKVVADGGQALPPALAPVVPALGAFPDLADHLAGFSSGLLSTAKIWVKAT